MPVLTVLAAVLLCRVLFAEGGIQNVKGHRMAQLLLKIPEQPGVEGLHQPMSVQSPLSNDLAAAAAKQAGRLCSSAQQHQHQHAIDANSGWVITKRQSERGARTWPTSIHSHEFKLSTQPQLRTTRCRLFRDSSCQSGGDTCGPIRSKKKCTPDGCLWCANRYSPWAGSDGACVTTDQAKYLPDITYRCERVAAV